MFLSQFFLALPHFRGTLAFETNLIPFVPFGGFLCSSVVKNPPAMQKIQVQSLGTENPLEEEMATHSSVLAWRIPWTEEPGRLQSNGVTKSRTGLSD